MWINGYIAIIRMYIIGNLAQLVARALRMGEVVSSILTVSTSFCTFSFTLAALPLNLLLHQCI